MNKSLNFLLVLLIVWFSFSFDSYIAIYINDMCFSLTKKIMTSNLFSKEILFLIAAVVMATNQYIMLFISGCFIGALFYKKNMVFKYTVITYTIYIITSIAISMVKYSEFYADEILLKIFTQFAVFVVLFCAICFGSFTAKNICERFLGREMGKP